MTTPPEEVVTQALVRAVDVPGLDRPIALITFDNGRDHRRPTTFGAAGLANLDAALDAVGDAGYAAVAFTGKPFVFAAGADLGMIATITDRAAALARRPERTPDLRPDPRPAGADVRLPQRPHPRRRAGARAGV